MDESAKKPSRGDAWALLALAVLLTALCGRELFAPAWLAPGLPLEDGQTQWLPWRVYGFGAVRAGSLPLWNPHILCGVPFVGAWQSALFYPPNLLFAWAPPGVAARLIVWLSLLLSAGFTYALARVLGANRLGGVVAAAGFTLGAPQLLRVYAGHWGATCAIPWAPLILLAVDRLVTTRRAAWVIVGAVAVGMQFLAGAPQYVLFSAIAVGVYAVLLALVDRSLPWPRKAAGLALSAAVYVAGALLAMVQLWPGIEAASYGARSLPMRPAWNLVFSWGPEGALTLLLPHLFGATSGSHWGRYNLWEMSAYVGAVVVALAVLGFRGKKRSVALLGTAVLMVVLALGEHGGLFAMLIHVGGPLRTIRGPAKFLCPLSLCVALLAGLGLTRLMTRRPRVLALRALVAVAVSAGVLVFGFRVAWRPNAWKSFSMDMKRQTAGQRLGFARPRAGPVFGDSLRAALALAGLAAGLGLAASGRRRAGLALAALAAVADLGLYAWPYLGRDAMFDVRQTGWDPEVVEWVRSRPGAPRVSLWASRFMNGAMAVDVDAPEGVEPNPPKWFHELFRAATQRPVDVAPSIYQTASPGALATWTGTRFVVTPLGRGRGRPPIFSGRMQAAYSWPKALPRCFVVHKKEPVQDTRESLAAMMRVDLRKAVVVPKDSPEPPPGPKRGGDAPPVYARTGPNGAEVLVRMGSPGWLVILDAYAPGWRASSRGRPLPLVRANHAFMAVPLPAGERLVELTYEPRGFRAAAWISFVTLAGLAVGAAFAMARGHGRQGKPGEASGFSAAPKGGDS